MKELKKKINKLRKMPIKDAAKKIGQKVSNKTYHSFRKNIIKFRPIDLKNELFLNFKPKCSFLYNPLEIDFYRGKLEELKIDRQIIIVADNLCKHQFNLLGSGDINLGSEIPWNMDFKVNFTWENKYYKDIKIIDLTNNADVKVPWELSRFQHLFTLGKAYWITNNEIYAIEFKKQIEDWIIKNPIEMNVNWTCTMDVAIRAVNWVTGYYFFRNSKEISETFWLEFNKSLYLHGNFIYKNLENKDQYTGNHYLSNIVGLVWLGIYFGDFKIPSIWNGNTPKRWLDFGISELEKEIKVQVNKDGTNYEASTSYHRLVTELFLVTTLLCTKNTISFSKEYLKRLEKMCEFIMHLTQPNGKSPLIGDADDGRLIIFSRGGSWDRDDFRHLLSIAGEFFNREDFRFFGSPYKEDALWTLGKWNNSNKNPVLTSTCFKDGGYYILRNERAYCCVRCGENSFRGEGVHSHNDQLSFTLNLDGEDIFIDPGAFIYTGDFKMRNLFRSTAMHNTLEIPNYEQNDFEAENLFYMKEQTFSECLMADSDIFIGQHQGYFQKFGVVHKRSFLLKATSLIIKDEIGKSNNNLKFKLNFILDPKVLISIAKNIVYLNKNHITINIVFNQEVKINIEDVHVSSGYGVKRRSKRLTIENSGNLLETSIMFNRKWGDKNEKSTNETTEKGPSTNKVYSRLNTRLL